ncbi:hypothetical protein H8356DRAFT_1617219 [Neocallimastix lanati (nom. inval.)]|uniref:DUF4291 domain-containing protein n=1 Tax=Neocallimastix californiae TaxID=1754190 RepID=A0A1Y2FRC7_9FUNG|nr:hypothetical protein H8356DRAFT_1617219 [Neocallimastix sp. JGI-2020a]ORY86538.1 hypothetical protein LY90DRAFT_696837 [Neocallimastix californiae]|eukprot:ORY86538.1 hypothetical protein LY90DRAFT_696837 [Neocallimastix californiae]
MEKCQIRAVYNEDTIRVYQAYSKKIGEEAIKLGTFGPSFKLTRMTWIKPSFLWMMYRCGWATKDKNQECVLGIDIKRQAFDYLIKNSVPSSKPKNNNIAITDEEWKEKIKNSDIRIQWDPERDIDGNPLSYRSVQLGLRGKAIENYVNNWIVNIEDITAYVLDLSQKKQEGIDIIPLLPKEKIYNIS